MFCAQRPVANHKRSSLSQTQEEKNWLGYNASRGTEHPYRRIESRIFFFR
jgi:hypothetical protein